MSIVMESTNAVREDDMPDASRTAAERVKATAEQLLESLLEIRENVKDRHTPRHVILEDLRRTLSDLQMLKSLSSRTLDEIDSREKTMDDRQIQLDRSWSYLSSIIIELKKNLEWIEDPEDPSTMLENIEDPEAIGRLTEKRYSDLRDELKSSTNENDQLKKELENVSNEVVMLQETLKELKESKPGVHLEQGRSLTPLTDPRTELKATQAVLRREKAHGESLKKRNKEYEETNLKLRAQIDSLNSQIKDQKTGLEESKAEIQSLVKSNLDLEVKNASLRADLLPQAERVEHAVTENAKLLNTIKALETSLDLERGRFDAVTKQKENLSTEHLELAYTNTTLTATISDLKTKLEAAETLLSEQANENSNWANDYAERLKSKDEDLEVAISSRNETLKEKETLVDAVTKLEREKIALQTGLDQEKHLRLKDKSDHENSWEVELVKHEGTVRGLNDRLADLQSQLTNVRSDFERRLANEEDGYMSTIQILRDELAKTKASLEKARILETQMDEIFRKSKNSLEEFRADKLKSPARQSILDSEHAGARDGIPTQSQEAESEAASQQLTSQTDSLRSGDPDAYFMRNPSQQPNTGRKREREHDSNSDLNASISKRRFLELDSVRVDQPRRQSHMPTTESVPPPPMASSSGLGRLLPRPAPTIEVARPDFEDIFAIPSTSSSSFSPSETDDSRSSTPTDFDGNRRTTQVKNQRRFEVLFRSLSAKWGEFCGVPAEWREHLKTHDTLVRLRSLYNKVEDRGKHPVQFLWKEDGLLTMACREKGGLSAGMIKRVQVNMLARTESLFSTGDSP